MTSLIGGFKDRKIESRSKVEPATLQYIGRYRQALDVNAQTFYELIATDVVEADSTDNTINATAHVARVGDLIKITSGALQYDIAVVQSITTNTITLSQTLASALATSVTFNILRPSAPIVSVGGAVSITSSTSGTATCTNVAGSASNVTLLAANTARLKATLYNDSTALCYVKLGATATSSSFTTIIFANGYYEVPESYTGIIDGIWASAAGAMRVTEIA